MEEGVKKGSERRQILQGGGGEDMGRGHSHLS